MYRQNTMQKTAFNRNTSYQGERIEEKVNRIVNNKEPIKDGAPLVYTERKDGIKEAYNIRTDRWEIAVEAMDKITKTHIAKREGTMGEQAKDGMRKEENQKGETQTADDTQAS